MGVYEIQGFWRKNGEEFAKLWSDKEGLFAVFTKYLVLDEDADVTRLCHYSKII